MNGLSGLTGGMGGGMTAFVVLKGIDQVSGPAQQAGNSLKKLQISATDIMAGIGMGALALTGYLSKIGAESMQVKKAYTEMADSMGADSEQLLQDIKRLSGGTVSELKLMAAANRAMLSGIKPDAIIKAMEGARAVATATGTTVIEQFERITRAMATMETETLKTAGVIVNQTEIFKEYAESVGKTTAQLTAQEKQTAFTNAVLSELEKIINRVGDAGSKLTEMEVFQQLTAALDNLKATIGEKLVPVVLPFINLLTKMVEWIGEHPAVIEKVLPALAALGLAIVAVKGAMMAFNAVAAANPVVLLGLAVSIPIVIKLLDRIKETFSITGQSVADMEAEVYSLGDSIETMSKEQLESGIERLKELDETLRQNGIIMGNIPQYLEEMEARLLTFGEVTAATVEETTLLERTLQKVINAGKEFSTVEEAIAAQAQDTLTALLEQEKVEMKKWETTEEFAERLRELGLNEEMVAKAMETGSIQLQGQEQLLEGLGNTYLEYLNSKREAYGLSVMESEGIASLTVALQQLEQQMSAVTEAAPAMQFPTELPYQISSIYRGPINPQTGFPEVSRKRMEEDISLQNQLNQSLEKTNSLLRDRNRLQDLGTTYQQKLAYALNQEGKARGAL